MPLAFGEGERRGRGALCGRQDGPCEESPQGLGRRNLEGPGQAEGSGTICFNLQIFSNIQQLSLEQVLRQGCLGTGRRTALGLLSVAVEIAGKDVTEYKAGICIDLEVYKSLGQMPVWLRRWRKGELSRAPPWHKAGGSGTRLTWLWGEDLWLDALESYELEEDDKIGAKAKAKEAEKVIVGGLQCVQAQVEEWLEEHMDGDKAKSTKRAYQAAWEKWTDWANCQGWLSPYLSPKDEAILNKNKVLGYLGYLGWLGSSAASLKLTVFAIKDARKRAGHGDMTGRMHLNRLWIVLSSLALWRRILPNGQGGCVSHCRC